MASKALILIRGGATSLAGNNNRIVSFSAVPSFLERKSKGRRNFSIKSSSSLDPPDIARLAETARISLTPQEIEEFGPKVQKVVEWFGQLQAVDLESIEPAIRADTEGEKFREDLPKTFENREAIIASIPSYEDPYIKVPKVLNKE